MDPGKSKVSQDRPSIRGKQHVVRLDIAMDDSSIVSRRECVQQSTRVGERFIWLQRSRSGDPRSQAFLTKLHNKTLVTVFQERIEDAYDRRMLHLREETRLPLLPLPVFWRGCQSQDFQRTLHS
jgi:hypothetical protein